jgi:isopenicillin N synthase-like dioxygenase
LNGNVAQSSQINQDMRDCAIDIDNALQKFGVFIINQNVISPYFTSKSFNSANELFSLSLESKLSVSTRAKGSIGRGYLPFGRESGLSSIYFEPKEGYSYGNPYSCNQTTAKNNVCSSLERPNVWPSDFTADCMTTFETLYNIKVKIANAIVRAIQLAYLINDEQNNLEKNESRFDYLSAVEGGEKISIMRIFHYFAENASYSEKKQLGSSPHTDWVRP